MKINKKIFLILIITIANCDFQKQESQNKGKALSDSINNEVEILKNDIESFQNDINILNDSIQKLKDVTIKLNYEFDLISSYELQEISGKNLYNYISLKLKDWRILNTKDYIKDWKKWFKISSLPYVCTGDFNNDKNLDYCALLKKKKENHLSIFVFYSTKKDFSHHLLEDNVGRTNYNGKPGEIEVYIHKVGKGVYNGIENEKEVELTLSHDAIEMISFETVSIIYYLKNGKYHKFWTSD